MTDCANQQPIQISPITISSEFEYRNSVMPRVRAHFGEFGCVYSPTFWSSSDSRPTWSSGFDSR